MKKNIFIVLGLMLCFVAVPAIAGRWVAVGTNLNGTNNNGLGDKKCYYIKYSVPAFSCQPITDASTGSFSTNGLIPQDFIATSVYATGQGLATGSSFTGILKPVNKTFSSNYYVTCAGADKNKCAYLCQSANGCNDGWGMKWYYKPRTLSYDYYFMKGSFGECANPSYAPSGGYYVNYTKSTTPQAAGDGTASFDNTYTGVYYSTSTTYSATRVTALRDSILGATSGLSPLTSTTPYQAWVYVSGMSVISATPVDCNQVW